MLALSPYPAPGPALVVDHPLAALGLVALVLVIPVIIAAWIRVRALAAPPTDVARAWFGFARQAQWLSIAGWFGWVAALTLTGVDRWTSTGLRYAGGAGLALGLIVLWVVPPALAGLAIQAITYDVQRRLRGSEWTLSEHLRCAVWQLAALLVPLALLGLTPVAFLTGHTSLAVISAIGVLVTRILFLRLYSQTLGLAPHAVTTGPLRDRLFDLGTRAGVPVRQLYVMPTTRGRIANAFAVQGGTVILTDYLLDHLSEREVVATLAHEIGHLKHDHPRRLVFTLIVSVMGAFALMSGLESWVRMPAALAAPIAIALATLATTLVARGFERVADRLAVDLTQDPEALITALTRLSRLNHVPLDWGKWAEKSLAHPSVVRRARAIAKHGGLPESRVSELLAALPPAEPRFTIGVRSKDQRLFSSLWKARTASNTGLTLLALYAVVPAITIALLHTDHPSLTLRAVGIAVAAILGIALSLAALNALALRPMLALRKRMFDRWVRRGIDPERCGGLFVGLSPGREPRIYENFAEWDVGLLFLTRQRLCYVGEETRFELTRAHVVSIALGPGLPAWISAPRVIVTWRDESRGLEGSCALVPVAVRTLGSIASEAGALCDRMRGWQRGVTGAHPDPAFEPMGPPPTGAVTSIAPATLVAPRALIHSVVLCTLASAAASVIVGLKFDGTIGYPDALIATLAVALFHRLPFWLRPRGAADRAAEATLDRAA